MSWWVIVILFSCSSTTLAERHYPTLAECELVARATARAVCVERGP